MKRYWPMLVIGFLSGCGGNVTSPDFFPQLKGVVIDSTTPVRFEELGLTRQYKLLGQYSTPPGSATEFTTREVMASSWESTEPGIASISNTGLATAVRNGGTGIRGKFGGFTSPAVSLTVIAPVLRAITLDPASASVPLGLRQSITATGTYVNADGSSIARSVVEPLSWTSSAPATASVTPTGNPVTVGTLLQSTTPVQIRASATAADGSVVERSAAITVTAPDLLQVLVRRGGTEINPPFALPRGATINLQAIGVYTDSSVPRDIPGAITWTSADAGGTVLSTATQPNGTLNVTGVNIGSSAVTAAALKNDASSTVASAPATVNVGNAILQSLDGARIIPSPALVAVGASLQLAVIGRFSDGTEAQVPATDLNWTASDTAIATVSQTGVAAGVRQGGIIVTAALKQTPASGAASVSTALTVTDQVCTGPLLATQGATVQTATTPVLCLACTVTDAPLAIDNNTASFAALNINLGLLLGSASLTATAPVNVPLVAGQRAGFIISRPAGELLSLALLGNVAISTLDGNDAELESATTADGLRLTLLGSYVIGQDAFILSMPVTQPFRKLRVAMDAGVVTAAQSLQVNSACAATTQ